MKIYILAFTLLFLLSCSDKEIEKDTPECIKKIIEDIKKQDSAGSPDKIYRYRYEGRTVYYIPPLCCDFPSRLLDEDCNLICNPDGGFSGAGDGRCPDFFKKAKDEKVIWDDDRVK